MAYTPELDRAASGFVRRIAWAAGRPMTSVPTELVFHVAQSVDAEKVCSACRDSSSCSQCYLHVRSHRELSGFAKLLKTQ